MSQSYQLELIGCTPEPLMAYLKALGIFRIVAEQKDPQARACWEFDTFSLRSILDRETLVDFFLDEYRPTPIVSPWNGGSGFKPKDNSKAMDTILGLGSPRFGLWTETITTGKRVLAQAEQMQWTKKADMKAWTLAQCRVQFPDDALDWLDASYVLTADGAKFPPLLGTGGNDGRLEFSKNYMQNVVSAMNLDEQRNGQSVASERLVAALFDKGSPQLLRKRSTGFFNPGGVGGANASVGFNDEALTNPWDYVLMFEGALLFAGAAARRLSPQSRTKAVFPFTVDNSAGGYGTSADSEYGDSSRAEFWVPLWDRPASLRELSHLVSEGRAQLGRRQVATGTDFARAVAGLGTARGVPQFHRYGFLVRNGLAYLAAPLGRFRVQRDNAAVDRANVLFDLDQWIDSLRRNLGGRNAPAGLGAMLRLLDDAIIEFCHRGQPPDLQDVLIAVGNAERWLAKSSIRKKVRPLNSLSWDWLKHADDNSPEFRLARALASILHQPNKPRDRKRQVGPIRENLEPVKSYPRVDWDQGSTSFAWRSGDPLSSLLAVLERRCLDGRMAGLSHPPLNSVYSIWAGDIGDVVDFLNGDLDPQRVADLALPLSFIRYRPRQSNSESSERSHFNAPFDLSTAYAVMKLTLLPRKFECQEFRADTDIWPEPAMLALLRAGRVNDSYRLASRRLRASGLQPLSDDPGISDRSDYGRRLAAALLFPLDERANKALAQRALRPPPDRQEPESELARQTGN